jgi:hypothetical protein
LTRKNCDDNNGSSKKKTRTHKTNQNKASDTKHKKKIAENKHQERSVVHQWYIGTGHGRQQRKQTQSWRNYSSSSSSSSRRGGGKKKTTKNKGKNQNTRNKINTKKKNYETSFFKKLNNFFSKARDGEILSRSERETSAAISFFLSSPQGNFCFLWGQKNKQTDTHKTTQIGSNS